MLSLLFHDVYAADPAESGFDGEIAARYKLPLHEFNEQVVRLAEVLEAAPVLAGQEHADFGVPVAITVDDGGLSYHSQVADLLEEQGWRGHCFMPTAWIGRPGFLERQHLRDLHQRGHVFGSHSVSHPMRFAACSYAEMVREWRDSRAELEDILGARVRTASLPGGYYSKQVAESAAEAGITTLFTSEPETRARNVHGCTVLGRYTIRRGDGPSYPARLVARASVARQAAWCKWNAKKVLKAALGAGYPRLTARLARLERGANSFKNGI
ncbi:MAG TPA: polysaccharide deacetylase family protein [Gammaproteobacteria bacterium]|jgi:peptidoglycan/xylan/chitin deacetylase (PgdA/CDA1 family)